MANEFTLGVSIQCRNGNYDSGLLSTQFFDDQITLGVAGEVQKIDVTESVLSAGTLANRGWLYMRNLDATNYIQYGFATGVYPLRLSAGMASLLYCEAATVVYMLANTAACELQYRWFEQ